LPGLHKRLACERYANAGEEFARQAAAWWAQQRRADEAVLVDETAEHLRQEADMGHRRVHQAEMAEWVANGVKSCDRCHAMLPLTSFSPDPKSPL
jgi:hypothetical protein